MLCYVINAVIFYVCFIQMVTRCSGVNTWPAEFAVLILEKGLEYRQALLACLLAYLLTYLLTYLLLGAEPFLRS